MGWGDVAREALGAAKDSFERVVRLEATINLIKDGVQQFERRLEESLHRHSESTKGELRNFDSRLRDLERHLSRTEAKVDGALAEAIRVTLERGYNNLPPRPPSGESNGG